MIPAIALNGVSYRAQRHFWRRPKTLIHDLTLSVAPGEICGFLGPNGAGKTTTLRLLLDSLRPSHGEARLFGRLARDPAARQGVGFLPERAATPLALTAWEWLWGHAVMAGLTGAQARRHITELLGRVGLAGREGQLMRTYSKGMLQRLGLAQALVATPRLLILDEPLSGLDPLGRQTVRQLISAVGAAGCAVFFSTHILADVEQVCDRVAILGRGRLRHVGTPAELLAEVGARGRQVEVVASAAPAAVLAGAQDIAHQPLRGGGHRFVAADGAQANALVQALHEAGAQVQLLAPLGGAGLEALFAAGDSDGQNA